MTVAQEADTTWGQWTAQMLDVMGKGSGSQKTPDVDRSRPRVLRWDRLKPQAAAEEAHTGLVQLMAQMLDTIISCSNGYQRQ